MGLGSIPNLLWILNLYCGQNLCPVELNINNSYCRADPTKRTKHYKSTAIIKLTVKAGAPFFFLYIHRGLSIVWYRLHLLTHSHSRVIVSEVVQLCPPPPLQFEDLNLSDCRRVELIIISTPAPLMTLHKMNVEPRPLLRRAMQIPTNFVVPVGECGSARVTSR